MFAAVSRFFRVLIITLFSLIFIVFAVDNRDSVSVNFFPFPYEVDLPLFIVALIFFIVGSIIGYSISLITKHHIKSALKGEKARNKALTNQIDSLRAEHQLSQSLTTDSPATQL